MLVLACTFDTEVDGCDAADAAADRPFTASVTQGQPPPNSEPPTMFPYLVGVRVRSEWLIRGVDIGKVPASLKDPNQSLWEAALSNADLENHRQGGNAVLPVRVTDVCNVTHDIEAAAITVPLGPAPGVRVSDLQLDIQYSPPEECAVPTSLTVPVAIVVSASAESAGASVALATSSGSFQGDVKNTSVRLAAAGSRASAPAVYFIPGASAGHAVINAYAAGSEPALEVVAIVAPPSITAPVTSLRRGVAYEVSVGSAGNLASCSAEPVLRGTSTITVIDPPAVAGVVTGTKSVRVEPLSCLEPERVGLTVAFASNAPNDAAVTLRCLDTLAQEASVTLRVVAAAGEADAGAN